MPQVIQTQNKQDQIADTLSRMIDISESIKRGKREAFMGKLDALRMATGSDAAMTEYLRRDSAKGGEVTKDLFGLIYKKKDLDKLVNQFANMPQSEEMAGLSILQTMMGGLEGADFDDVTQQQQQQQQQQETPVTPSPVQAEIDGMNVKTTAPKQQENTVMKEMIQRDEKLSPPPAPLYSMPIAIDESVKRNIVPKEKAGIIKGTMNKILSIVKKDKITKEDEKQIEAMDKNLTNSLGPEKRKEILNNLEANLVDASKHNPKSIIMVSNLLNKPGYLNLLDTVPMSDEMKIEGMRYAEKQMESLQKELDSLRDYGIKLDGLLEKDPKNKVLLEKVVKNSNNIEAAQGKYNILATGSKYLGSSYAIKTTEGGHFLWFENPDKNEAFVGESGVTNITTDKKDNIKSVSIPGQGTVKVVDNSSAPPKPSQAEIDAYNAGLKMVESGKMSKSSFENTKYYQAVTGYNKWLNANGKPSALSTNEKPTALEEAGRILSDLKAKKDEFLNNAKNWLTGTK